LGVITEKFIMGTFILPGTSTSWTRYDVPLVPPSRKAWVEKGESVM